MSSGPEHIIPKSVVDQLRLREARAAFQAWATQPHSESYIDSEGEERCVTCDKWLEPGYYEIEDHLKSQGLSHE